MKLDRFINRPVLSTVISILIVILGILGLLSLPITQYPDIAPPTVSVKATYTGANAQTVLNSVIAPLEDQINGVENMMYMTSSASNNGSAEISIYFKQGTDPDMAAVNVQNRVSMAQGLLPAEVTQIGVTTQKRQNSMLIVFSVYDAEDRYDQRFIENYAKINLIPEVQRVPGVGDANVLGTDYSMRIWLKPDVMAQYKLVPNDVAGVLAEQNVEAAPGSFGERGNQSFQYTIRYKGRLQEVSEFENMVVKALPDGEVLRLKDIADIELGRLTYNFVNKVNGHSAVTCIVYQMAGTNATETINNIQNLLEETEKILPPGLKIDVGMNANDFLYASIHEELKTLIDAVESARFIPKKKSAALVEKLGSLTSRHNAEKLVRNVDVENRLKADDEKIYYIMEALNDAINASKKVCLGMFKRTESVPIFSGQLACVHFFT